MCAKSLQSRLTLCDPTDHTPPGSCLHGYSPGKNIGVGCQAPPPGIFPDPGIKLASPVSPALAASSLPLAPPGKPQLDYIASKQ